MGNIKFIQEALNQINISYPIIGEYVVHKAIDFVLSQVKKSKDKIFDLEKDGIQDHFIKEFRHIDIIKQYINGILNWSESENIIQSFNPKFNSEYYVYQTFKRLGSNDKNNSLSLDSILLNRRNYIFKGGPGTGKSTFLKHLLNTSFNDSNFIKKNNYFPYLLKCRELTVSKLKPNIEKDDETNKKIPLSQERLIRLVENSYILTSILSELGFYIRFPNAFKNNDTYISWVKELEGFFLEIADANSILFLIDGFDEVQEEITKTALIDLLAKIALKCPDCNFIITSRETNSLGSFSNTFSYEINFFKDEQLNLFVDNWFTHSLEKGELLKIKLRNRPYFDTLCRPLTLAFICALFEKNNSDIPFKGTEIYLQIVDLLIDKWERENRIQRHSKYIGFSKEQKIRFLSEFSFKLTIPRGEKEFSKENLKTYLKPLLKKYKIPIDELDFLVEEIENHTGLFLEIGNKYCFSHFSIQEFLVAYHIFNIGSIPKNQDTLNSLPEVLAICVALSSDPSEYFIELYLQFLSKYTAQSKSQILKFLDRLATESPDFECSEFLGIYLLCLYSGLVVDKDNFNKNLNDKFAERIQTFDTKQIDLAFERILTNEAVSQSVFKGLENYYLVFDLKNNFSVYTIKEYLKHTEIHPFPQFLVINSDLFH